MTKKLNFIKDSKEAELNSNMFNLVNITILENVKKSTKITRMLTEHYKQAKTETFLAKITITIINSLLTQNRKVFVLNREFLFNLAKKDLNHYNELKFSKGNYQMIVEHLSKFLCDFERVKRGQFYVLLATVKHEGLLKLLTSDIESQKKEVMDFINTNHKQKEQENTQENSTPKSSFRKRTIT